MPSEFRTPRTLAGWFQLDYFNRRTFFRGWWGGLPLLVGAASLLGLGLMLWAGGRRTFQAGPLSAPHALFNDRCELCHDGHFKTLSRMWSGDSVGSISDEKCLSCHAGSHHNEHAKMDRCVSCHKEHRGHPALVRIDDRRCAECHGDLKRQDGTTSQVTSFAEGKHPPFLEAKDPGTIRFDHKSHLTPKRLRDVEHRLDCADCHRADAAGRYMLPVTFEQHCKKCHPVTVQVGGDQADPELVQAARAFANEPLPHPAKGQSIDTVRAAIRDRVARFIAGPGNERFLKTKEESGRLPLPASSPREEREYAWVKRTAAELEMVVFDGGGGCRSCHTVTIKDRTPVIAAPAVPERWWKQATFRHDAHRMMKCEECHDARGSEKSGDVLMPKMDLCLKCHDSSVRRGKARADCVECHVYHDPLAQRAEREKGRWAVEELLNAAK
jgi:predicted CXXCH cytochrome family protein